MIESSKKVKPWRETVKYDAMTVVENHGFYGDKLPAFKGPVDVTLIFTVKKSKSAPKRRRTWPDRKPDIDKLCRSTLDALKTAGVFEDDSRVVRLTALKVFPNEHPDALGVLGAVIRISAVTEAQP